MFFPLLGVSAFVGATDHQIDWRKALFSQGWQPSVGICLSTCFHCNGEMQSTALLLFRAVSASAELGSQIVLGIGLKIRGEQEDEMIMCKGDVIKSNCYCSLFKSPFGMASGVEYHKNVEEKGAQT